VFGTQAAGVLALQSGNVSYLFNPLGLDKGFQDQLRGTNGLTLVKNANNSIRFLAFNMRREPMKRLAFRQAVATLIDREFVTGRVLQGIAYPLKSVVPPANAAWYNPNLKVAGQGLTRGDRIAAAVRLLESDGFSWTRKPRLGPDGTLLEPGVGLRLPSGEPVQPLELLTPTEAYDAMRAAFGTWVERWLNEVGIPVRARQTAFNMLMSRVNDRQDTDFWILGFTLTPYPTFLSNFFHSRYAQPRGRNTAGYMNPAYDKLVDSFVEEADDMARARALAFELQEVLNRDVPWIPLFDTPIVEAYRSDQVVFPTTTVMGGIQGAPRIGFVNAVALAQ
jgi:ABC-type transport system substrate-binding protein